MDKIDLQSIGLIDRFRQEATLYDGLFLARVSVQHRDLYSVMCSQGEIQARVSGTFSYQAGDNTDFPAVGDWVMIDRTDNRSGDAIIHQVLSRKSIIERKAAGTSGQIQIVAVNVDVIFICMALNRDFNLRRLERYLSIALNSAAHPVIVLTKADLCENLDVRLSDVKSVAVGTDIVVISNIIPEGYKEVQPYIKKGVTIAFIGSSGVGKSTLINNLIGENIQFTREIREDDRGKHATTSRQLILLPGGGVVIDTPGMRELHLDNADLERSFEDIMELAADCKFRNCTHSGEPDCQVRQAIENGNLTEKRLENFKKLQKEVGYQGLNSRQLEQKKIENMFGSLGMMKKAMDKAKNKNKIG